MVNFFSVAHFDKVLLSSTQFVISSKFHAGNHFAEYTVLELVQCGNLRIFLSLRFYVKSTFTESRSAKSAILAHLEALHFNIL